jgi:transcriptional regulator with XRE-family HTH domain
VRATREARHLSVTALAEKAELSKSEISAIENGRITLPGADKRRRLARALGVSHLDLLVAAGEIAEDEIGSANAVGVVEWPSDESATKILNLVRSIEWDANPELTDDVERILTGVRRGFEGAPRSRA